MTGAWGQSPCFENASAPDFGFTAWAAVCAKDSPTFQAEIDRLRRLSAGASRGGYARTTGSLDRYDWDELAELLARQPREQDQRRFAWKNTDRATDDGLSHVRAYLRGAGKVARLRLGTEGAAPFVHGLVRGSGYQATFATLHDHPAPQGSTASRLAAHITGRPAQATANLILWRRKRPADARLLPPASAPASGQSGFSARFAGSKFRQVL